MKVRNRSSWPITVRTCETSFEVEPGRSFSISDVNEIQNLLDIRKDIIVGQDLTEVVGSTLRE